MVLFVNIEATDTCQFHSPGDWTDDTKEYKDTDPKDEYDSEQQPILDGQLRSNEEKNIPPNINKENLNNQERDSHNIREKNPMPEVYNYGQQAINKAWRQPYGRADQEIYQYNNLQKQGQNGDAAYQHENLAQALAAQKGSKNKV